MVRSKLGKLYLREGSYLVIFCFYPSIQYYNFSRCRRQHPLISKGLAVQSDGVNREAASALNFRVLAGSFRLLLLRKKDSGVYCKLIRWTWSDTKFGEFRCNAHTIRLFMVPSPFQLEVLEYLWPLKEVTMILEL